MLDQFFRLETAETPLPTSLRKTPPTQAHHSNTDTGRKVDLADEQTIQRVAGVK